jgi:hypothetical protein
MIRVSLLRGLGSCQKSSLIRNNSTVFGSGLRRNANSTAIAGRGTVINHRTLSTTTNTSTATATTISTATDQPKKDNGIPWALILPLGFIGAVIAYFYRGNKNAKNEAAFRIQLKENQFMSPEELVQIRESNKLSLEIFNELSKRTKQAFSSASEINLRSFLDGFCIDQLGGDFQARGTLHSRHIFDRMEKALMNKNGKGESKVDLRTALLAVSTAVLTEPSELIHAFFPLLNEDNGFVNSDHTMSYDRYVEVVRILDETNQLPVRVLIKSETAYPFNQFTRAQPEEVAAKSLNSLNPNLKDKEPEKFIQERKQRPITEEEFVHLLLSTDLCVWGACWNKPAITTAAATTTT